MRKNLAIWLILIGFVYSCKVEEPYYDARFLLPLAKTLIKVEQITTLENIGFKDSILFSSTDLGSYTGPLPDTTIPYVGPLYFIDSDDNYIAAISDTCEIRLTIDNRLPFNIKAGTKIRIKNYDTTGVNKDTVFVGEITKDIARNTSSEISIFIPAPTVRFLNDLELYFTDFRTSGTAPFPISPGGYVKVDFRIIVIRAKTVEIEPTKLYTLGDTSTFSFDGAGDAAKFNNGILSLYIKNGLPVSFDLQGYFLDENKQLLDSLFNFSTLMDSGSVIGPDGAVVVNSAREAVIVTQWNETKFNKIRNSKYLVTRGEFLVSERPNPGNIFLKHEDQVDMQLVGRFNVVINE